MNQKYIEIFENFASAIISKDYEKAYSFFSSCLKEIISKEKLQEIFETYLIEINKEWNTNNELEYPNDFSIDENTAIDYSHFLNEKNNYSLFKSSKSLPIDINNENFKSWAVISFLASEKQSEYLEFDGWFDFWCILIEKNDNLEIGYFEIHDLD